MDNAGLDGVTHRVLLAKALGAVRPENEVLLVVLAGVEEQCVALESELSTVLDTGLALLAGTVVFAVVFALEAEPGAGPGLVFITLPGLFAEIPGGGFVGLAFFSLLVLAAWSSGISLLEVVVALCVDRFGMLRRNAALVAGALIWALGLASAFSGEFLDFMDNLTTRYMLPTGGLLIALSAGWLLGAEDREAGFRALPGGGEFWAKGWTVLIRFVTPLLVLLVILNGLGLF